MQAAVVSSHSQSGNCLIALHSVMLVCFTGMETVLYVVCAACIIIPQYTRNFRGVFVYMRHICTSFSDCKPVLAYTSCFITQTDHCSHHSSAVVSSRLWCTECHSTTEYAHRNSSIAALLLALL